MAMVTHDLNPTPIGRQKQVELCEFDASLVCIVTYR